ncbi:MAG: ATP-binding protein, partial [Alphaproteobacteria bacterium]
VAACRAALDLAREIAVFGEDMRCSHGIQFGVRMGLHSGEVVYGPIESTVSAQGRTAAIAARIEQLAPPGAIRVSDSTARLVERSFELRDMGTTELRGVSKPMRIFELAGTRARRGATKVVSAETPFVGRQVELALLEALIYRAGPAVVSITGEAGIGKTRLLDELARRYEAAGVATLIRLSALESERDTPFAFYRRALRRLLDVRGGETIESARERVSGRLLVADPKVREDLPRILYLLGLGHAGSPPQVTMDGLHAELAAVSARLASLVISADRRRVVAFDDLQWIDGPSLGVLRRGIDEEFIRPDLLITAQRSGSELGLSGTKAYAGSLHLSPHLDAEMDELLLLLLGSDPSVDDLRRLLRERSGGNPLFLGEMVRALRESGDLEGEAGRLRLARTQAIDELPATLGTLLAARIDSLPTTDRQLLRLAATIGRPFDVRLLARASGRPPIAVGESLARLRVGEILVPAVGPDRDHESFAFRHQLLADAALATLLSGTRARLHAAVAEALEAEPDADLQASRIAAHRAQAGENAAAARWHFRAAVFAAPREPRRALDHLRESDRMLDAEESPAADRLRLDLRVATLDLGWRHGLAPSEAARLHDEGRRLATKLGDPHAGAVLAAGHAAILGMSGALAEVAPLVRDSRELSADVADRGLDLSLRTTRSLALYAAGDLGGVLRECAEPLRPDDLALQPQSLGGSKVVEYMTLRGTALVDTGRFGEGRRALDEAIAEARRSGSA